MPTLTRSGLYEIRHIASQRRYIGSSVNVSKRWREHRHWLRKRNHCNQRLQRAWNKYGPGAFSFRVLAVLEPAALMDAENRLLALVVGRADCYNLARSADAPMRGRTHSAAAMEKLEKVYAARRGVALSPATRARMSAAKMGHTTSPETREKIAAAQRGIPRAPHTPEARAKISAAGMGRPGQQITPERRARMEAGRRNVPPHRHTAAARAKISAARKGIVFSEEHRAKLRAAKLGSTISPATRAKMSASHRARLAAHHT